MSSKSTVKFTSTIDATAFFPDGPKGMIGVAYHEFMKKCPNTTIGYINCKGIDSELKPRTSDGDDSLQLTSLQTLSTVTREMAKKSGLSKLFLDFCLTIPGGRMDVTIDYHTSQDELFEFMKEVILALRSHSQNMYKLFVCINTESVAEKLKITMATQQLLEWNQNSEYTHMSVDTNVLNGTYPVVVTFENVNLRV